jgi:hypothetical protein
MTKRRDFQNLTVNVVFVGLSVAITACGGADSTDTVNDGNSVSVGGATSSVGGATATSDGGTSSAGVGGTASTSNGGDSAVFLGGTTSTSIGGTTSVVTGGTVATSVGGFKSSSGGTTSKVTTATSVGGTPSVSTGTSKSVLTWSKLYSTYFASGTSGNCVSCHSFGASATSLYTKLKQVGQISGTSSKLVTSSSILVWFGGKMPDGSTAKNATAVADLKAWVAAGAVNN